MTFRELLGEAVFSDLTRPAKELAKRFRNTGNRHWKLVGRRWVRGKQWHPAFTGNSRKSLPIQMIGRLP